MYQGASDDFMGRGIPSPPPARTWVDLEAEIVVITNDVPWA